MFFNVFGNKWVREDLKEFTKAKYNEYRALKQSNEFMKQVWSWEWLKKWIWFKAWTIRPNWVPEQIPVRKVFITIEDWKVTINWELMDWSYIDQAVFANEKDVIKIAKDIAAKNMKMLESNYDYYKKELSDIEVAMQRWQEVLDAQSAKEMKEASEIKEADKAQVDKMKEKLVKDAKELEAVREQHAEAKKPKKVKKTSTSNK